MRAFHIYVASCVADGGIYHYIFEDGKLREVSKTTSDQPMYLALEGDRLYAVLREPFADSHNSGVCHWDIDADGNLHDQSEIVSTGGRCGCHLAVENGHTYVANYLSGSVSMLPEGMVVTHSGAGINPVRQEAPHVHFVGFTPDRKWLLVVDLGLDTIFMYSPDLRTSKRVEVPAGHGCRHLAWSEDGQYCFCVNELASSISVFHYAQDTLALLDTVPVLPENCRVNNTAAAIRVAGECVWFSIRGCDQVVMLKHHEGVLTEPVFVSCGGESPRDINIMEDILFCANENSDSVTTLRIGNGELKAMDMRISMPKPLCIVFRDKK